MLQEDINNGDGISQKPDEKLKSSITNFVNEVSQFFNKELLDAKAREVGFVERESKLTGHLFLSIFTFGMSIYGTPSLNELVGLLNLIVPNLELSREGLHQRINEKAVDFFEAMLSIGIALQIPENLDLSILNQVERILIFDSTSFQLPDELAEYFKGSGGNASESAVKILFGYDLKSSQFFYLVLNGTDPDHLIKSGLIDEICPHDLEISDLGFFNVETFSEIEKKGAFYLSRLKTNITIYQKDEHENLEVFDLVGFCQNMSTSQSEIEVYLKKDKILIKTRLIIEKVPEEIKAERLRRINKTNKKKGRKTRQKTKILQGFSLYITNTSNEVFPTYFIRYLYAIRWQIELIFKNWKSNFNLDKVTGKRPERIKCMIFAKLLFIFITTKIAITARNYAWIKYKREVSIYQATKHLKIVASIWLMHIINHPENIKIILNDAINFIIENCLKEKSRKRIYPLRFLEIIEKNALT